MTPPPPYTGPPAVTPPPPYTGPPAPPARTESPLADGEWHRMHPLTPLLRGGLALVVITGLVVSNFRDRLFTIFLPDGVDIDSGDPVEFVLSHDLVALALVAVVVLVAVFVGLFTVSWRFHTFRITGDDVEVRQGVLFRSHRRAPLDRVQGVDLTRPMLARLVGLAKLEVVGAGVSGNVKLEYLRTTDAESVRGDILRLASGSQRALRQAPGPDGAAQAPGGAAQGPGHPPAGPGGAVTGPGGPTPAPGGLPRGASPAPGAGLPSNGGRAGVVSSAVSTVSAGISGIIDGVDGPVEEPASVVSIPVGRLIASQVLDTGTLWLLAVFAGAVAAAVAWSGFVVFAFIPVLLAFLGFKVRSMMRSLRYSIAPTSSGVRITFGLFTTVTETLPPGRVHAVEVRQPILWRPFGWWSVAVNRLSGRAMTENGSDQFTTVLPVGTRSDVERVLRLLLPSLPEDEWHDVFEDGILGPRADDPYLNTPARARFLRPLSWRRNGVLATRDALFVRRGVVWRTLGVFPLARLQSLGVEQGPLARALAVARLRPHTIAGPVTGAVGALDAAAATSVWRSAEAGAIDAARDDRSHRWAGA